MKIESVEIYAISFFAVFGFIWMFLIVPFLRGSVWFLSLSPPFQYLLFNIGYVFLFSIFIGLPINFIKKGMSGIILIDMVLTGLVIFLFSSFIVDLWSVPYAIDFSGRFMMFEPGAMMTASPDYMLAWSYERFLPMNFLYFNIFGVSLLYILVYFVPPILTVVFSAFVFFPEKFMPLLGV